MSDKTLPALPAIEDERAAFEAWLNPGLHPGNVSPWVPPGRYEKDTHSLAWLAWQARAALAAQKPAGAVAPFGWAIVDKRGCEAQTRLAKGYFYLEVQQRGPFTAEDARGWDAELPGLAPHRVVPLFAEAQPQKAPLTEADINAAVQAERERCAAICDELESIWSAHKDVALLNDLIALSNAQSGEPRAARAIKAQIMSPPPAWPGIGTKPAEGG